MTKLGSVPVILGIAAATASCGRSALELGEPPAVPEHVSSTPPNACGGSASLSGTPGTPCRPCGVWMCVAPDAVRCAAAPLNNCGECGPTPVEQCNGYDDNCDGSVDEGCVIRLGQTITREVRVRIAEDGAVAADANGSAGSRDVIYVEIDDPARVDVLTNFAEPFGVADDPSREDSASIGVEFVAWVRDETEVVIYDRRQASIVAETDSTMGRASQPVVAADRVLFTLENMHGTHLWQWSRDGFAPLTNLEGRQTQVDRDGDWIVFEQANTDSPIFGRQVVALHLATSERVTLSEGLEGWHVAPAIHEQRVVWQQSTGASAPSREGNVWLFDLATRQRIQLSQDRVALAPRISGRYVCWTGEERLEVEGGFYPESVVRLLDLESLEQATVGPGFDCDLAGRHLVYLNRARRLADPYYRFIDGSLF